ncbi:MAG: hypothetical protein EOO38_28215 [Cytophagaceae bacterium]|nr:MAG: hypothetical protein EOO38_28215 [Cytophagaceae bacterium]
MIANDIAAAPHNSVLQRLALKNHYREQMGGMFWGMSGVTPSFGLQGLLLLCAVLALQDTRSGIVPRWADQFMYWTVWYSGGIAGLYGYFTNRLRTVHHPSAGK